MDFDFADEDAPEKLQLLPDEVDPPTPVGEKLCNHSVRWEAGGSRRKPLLRPFNGVQRHRR